MATISRFEDLEVWQLARVQCQEISALIKRGDFRDDVPLRDQINRASGLVMDNISEGFDRFSKADFRHFLVISRGSNAEVRSQIYRSRDRDYFSEDTFQRLKQASIMLGVKLHNFIGYLSGTPYKTKPSPTPLQPDNNRTEVKEADKNYLSDIKTLAYDLPEEFIKLFMK